MFNASYILPKTIIIAILVLLCGNSNLAQTRMTDGSTPASLALGPTSSNPAASDFGSINLYNGRLNYTLPLVNGGGRGDASHEVSVSINNRWILEHYYEESLGGNPNQYQIPTFNPWWGHEFRYMPGKLLPRSRVHPDTSEIPCGHESNPAGSAEVTLVFVSQDGSEIKLVSKEKGEHVSLLCVQGQPGVYSAQSLGNEFISTDGSGVRFVADQTIFDTTITSGILISGKMYFRDGSHYRIDNGWVSSLIDRNGNKTSFVYSGSSYNDKLVQITDSVGRVVNISYLNQDSQYGLHDRITYSGLAGETQTVIVSYAPLVDTLRLGETLKTLNQLFGGTLTCPLGNSACGNEVVNGMTIKSVWLPGNRQYRYYYNSYMELARVETPAGVAYEYDWSGSVEGEPEHGVVIQWEGGTPIPEIFRQLIEKRTYVDGTSGTSFTSRNTLSKAVATTTSNPVSTRDVKVFDYANSLQGRQSHKFYGSPVVHGSFSDPTMAGLEARQFETLYFGSDNSTVIRREMTNWSMIALTNSWIDPRPASELSIIFEGSKALALMTSKEYDGNGVGEFSFLKHLNLKRVESYGYKAVGLSTAQTGDFSTIATLFTTADRIALSESDYLYDPNYKARGLILLPQETRILNPVNPSQVLKRTTNIYDEPAFFDSGYLVSYWQDPQSNLRGNVTTTRKWQRETDSWLESHTMFDNFGNVRKIWDASGDPTKFVEIQYDPAYLYSYPTKIIAPAPDLSDSTGTNQTSTIETTYDFNTGLTLTVKDDFGQIIKSEYDELLRPTRVFGENFATPETQMFYGQTDGNGQYPPDQRFVKHRKQVDSTNWNEITKWLDGVSRPIKTRTKDSQGDVYVETVYDSVGRVSRISNPYRIGDTVYWSKSRLDIQGRTVEIFAPTELGGLDNALSLGKATFDISTVPGYVGTVVVTSDASNRRRRKITNASGKLVRVDEPTSFNGTETADLGTLENPIQATSYSFDTEGNLVQVIQGSQVRSFAYDSSGRITSATNPESGTVTYTYDVLGNLKTKRDSRGIKTIYDYDRLNRIIKRCYRVVGSGSLGAMSCDQSASEQAEPSTPDVSFFYDGKGLAQTGSFTKGKLTKVQNSDSATLYTNFDGLGNILEHEQVTDGQVYQTAYKYSLSGQLLEQTNPSGKILRTFYDTDGDISSIVNNGKIRSSSYSYRANGSISAMRLGNGLWESSSQNSLSQVTELRLGASLATASLWKTEYEYGELQQNGTVDSSKNTGSVARQILTVPTNQLTEGFVSTQTYSYDGLYRLSFAKEQIGENEEWGQVFLYDRFGNRTFDEPTTSTLPKDCTQGEVAAVCSQTRKKLNPTPSEVDNRFSSADGYQYDPAGNLILDTDGNSYTYDALNKQIQISNGTTTKGTYVYDGEGRRVKKIDPAETTLFVYDGFGKLIAEYSDNASPVSWESQTKYLTSDVLGSTRVITDESGKVVSRRDYLPFGEQAQSDEDNRKIDLGYGEDGDVRNSFASYEKDFESGLEYAQNRYYASNHGRFTSVDPLMASGKSNDPQTWNRYVYVKNNPLNRIDPFGLIDCPPERHCYYNEAGNYVYQDPVLGEVIVGSAKRTKRTFGDIIRKSVSAIGDGLKAIPKSLQKSYDWTIRKLDPGTWVPTLPSPPTLPTDPGPGPIEPGTGVPDANAPDPTSDDVPADTGLSKEEIAILVAKIGIVAFKAWLAETNKDREQLPDDTVVVRGGENPDLTRGKELSGSKGEDLYDAGKGVRNGQVWHTTARRIRLGGGRVWWKPEPAYPGGPENNQHVGIVLGLIDPTKGGFKGPVPNPAPPHERIPGDPNRRR